MNAATGQLTPDDLEFLARPLHGFLTVAGSAQPPQPRPIWYEATPAGTIEFFTEPDALKVRRLHRDPRASLIVAAPVGERERWVSVAGRTTLETGGAHDLCSRLAARYWDLGDQVRAGDLAEMLAGDLLRVIIHPETVHRYTY